jgi:tetratricopeptide (TPR) repeat protein
MHKTPSELQQLLDTVRRDASSPPGSSLRLAALRELVGLCPAFVPGLLALSRAMLLGKEEVTDSQAYFAEVEQILRDAVEASSEEASALIELAHFTDAIRDAPADAEPLFAEAARRALNLLEEAWAGQIGVLGQQEKLEAALEVAEQARRVLPHSTRIAEAVEFARQCATS